MVMGKDEVGHDVKPEEIPCPCSRIILRPPGSETICSCGKKHPATKDKCVECGKRTDSTCGYCGEPYCGSHGDPHCAKSQMENK